MMTDNMIEIALKHVGNAAEKAAEYESVFKEMAYYYIRTMEGDDVTEEAYELMSKYNLVDEDGFWITEEDR